MVKIYKLIDPITMEIRYVGKTITSLNDRLKVHIRQSKATKKHTHKEAWIKGLLNQNTKPIIELIEEVENEIWVERECFWISKLPNLTNISIGGDSGGAGVKHTEERKQQSRERVKTIKGFYKSGVGRKWTEEQKEKRRNKKPWNKGLKGTHKASLETKEKMSNSQKGHTRSGFKWSEESKEKFKEAHKKSWETRRKNKEVICVQ